MYAHVGDIQDAGSARWADEEDGNHEHPRADKQDAEGGEGQTHRGASANPSKGIAAFHWDT